MLALRARELRIPCLLIYEATEAHVGRSASGARPELLPAAALVADHDLLAHLAVGGVMMMMSTSGLGLDSP